MTITADDPWRAAPRISRAAFRALLAGTPAGEERDAGEYWDAIAGRGIDPLYIIAQFNHESNLGSNGTAATTHSWGNTRTPNFGIDYEPPTVAGRSGVFPVFRTWMDGLVTTVERYLAPTWYYHDRPTIGSIFVFAGPVWAPAGDLNDPNGYLASVLAFMNANADGGRPLVTDTPYDRVHIAADLGPTRALADIKWFIVHDTEGSFPGDEAVLTSAAPPVESAHLLIGRAPGQCLLVVPLDTTAWTAGNDAVSRQAVQVELSRNPAAGETDYTDYQYEKLAAVFTWCVAQGMVNVPAVYIGRRDADGGPQPDAPGIIGHQDVPDPDHPGQWGGVAHHTDPGPSFQWDRFVGLIGAPPVTPADSYLHFDAVPSYIGGGFKDFWGAKGGLDLFGLPLTNEVTESDRTCQYFERAVFEYHPELPARPDVPGGGRVLLRRLGAEAAARGGYAGPGIDPDVFDGAQAARGGKG